MLQQCTAVALLLSFLRTVPGLVQRTCSSTAAYLQYICSIFAENSTHVAAVLQQKFPFFPLLTVQSEE